LRGAKYVMKVVYDPNDLYSKGARIPLGEFLTGVRAGVFPVGMKVEKVAETSNFTVGINDIGNYCLYDDCNSNWSISINANSGSGFQLRRAYPRKVYKA